jgi:PAS domain S-box-containing protein
MVPSAVGVIVCAATVILRPETSALFLISFRAASITAFGIVFATSGTEHQLSYVSPSVERLTGYTPEEAINLTVDMLHPPGSLYLIRDHIHRLQASGRKAGEKMQSPLK